MARISKPEVGRTYWDEGGDKMTVVPVEDDIAIGYHRSNISGKIISSCYYKRTGGKWNLYNEPYNYKRDHDADPTAPAVVPIDIANERRQLNELTPAGEMKRWQYATIDALLTELATARETIETLTAENERLAKQGIDAVMLLRRIVSSERPAKVIVQAAGWLGRNELFGSPLR